MSHAPMLFAATGVLCAMMSHAAEPTLDWKRLADLNDPRGFAGQFVGVSHDRLLLYGGTNFPDKPVWDGGVKAWYRDVFVLDDLVGAWKKLGPLTGERPVGYGVSLPV